MNTLLEQFTGMDKMTDQVIASDFLLASKAGLTNYAVALTEATTPELRQMLKRQLNDAITTHETITNYMVKNGYYQPYNLQQQFNIDIQAANTALGLAQMFH